MAQAGMLPAFEGIDGEGLYTAEQLEDYYQWAGEHDAEHRAEFYYAGVQDMWNVPPSTIQAALAQEEAEIVRLFGDGRRR
jgi:hypothetical protein